MRAFSPGIDVDECFPSTTSRLTLNAQAEGTELIGDPGAELASVGINLTSMTMSK
jgi:hypothetical protein